MGIDSWCWVKEIFRFLQKPGPVMNWKLSEIRRNLHFGSRTISLWSQSFWKPDVHINSYRTSSWFPEEWFHHQSFWNLELPTDQSLFSNVFHSRRLIACPSRSQTDLSSWFNQDFLEISKWIERDFHMNNAYNGVHSASDLPCACRKLPPVLNGSDDNKNTDFFQTTSNVSRKVSLFHSLQ